MALSIDFFESLNDSYPVDLSEFTNMCSSSAQQPTNSLKNSAVTLPTDLRIGSKVRITSNKNFPWLINFKSTGRYPVIASASEISCAIRLSMNGYAENSAIADKLDIIPTPMILLQAATMYYQSAAPSLKPVFPRLEGTFSNKKTTKSACEIALLTEWAESFSHLYETWLSGEREYFYACSYSFTVLFTRALKEKEQDIKKSCRNKSQSPRPSSPSSTSSMMRFHQVFDSENSNEPSYSDTNQPSHQILITPTTLGFREMLLAEGVNFMLPLRNKSFIDYAMEKGDKDFLPVKKPEDEEVDDLDEDEWLKDIGISPKSTITFRKAHSYIDFSAVSFEELDMEDVKPVSASVFDQNVDPTDPGATRKRKASRMTSSQSQSVVPEDASRSTIVISESKSIDLFYRMMLSHKVGVSKNGLHAGLPPTLIAPSPFLGAIPKRLKMSSQITNRSNELKYILEMHDGPVMPFVARMLAEFLAVCFSETTSDNSSKKNTGQAHVQILGQIPYAGLNEAVKTKLAANVNEFHVDLSSRSFNF